MSYKPAATTIRGIPLLSMLFTVLLLSGCLIDVALPVYRIGVVLPIEGRYREIGYDVFFASQAAAIVTAEDSSMDGYRVEPVIYDDFGDPSRAAAQAEALSADPDVLIVVGHWRITTTEAAIPVYQQAEIPLLTTSGDIALPPNTANIFILDAPPEVKQQALTDYLAAQGIAPSAVYIAPPGEDITEAAREINAINARVAIGPASWGLRQFHALTHGQPGEVLFLTNAIWPGDLREADSFRATLLTAVPDASEPGPYSALAFEAFTLAIDAIRQAHAAGPLTRQRVANALRTGEFNGLTAPITFDETGFRRRAPLYLYRWEDTADAPMLMERLQ